MMGTPENEAPESFWQAPLDEAAGRLAALLTEEDAALLTIYDDNGGYGHPDHIKVHQVGLRAAVLAGTRRVVEATMNRDHLRRVISAGREAGAVADEEVPDVSEESSFGKPESELTTCIDVTDLLDVKRASMAAHASQIDEASFFLQMPEEAFAASFGYEWFIRRDREPGGEMDTDLLAGL
jgi:LmbE family N-acetylglucosaminyl deacetylase